MADGRANGTTRPRDHETTGPRDHETTRHPEKHRRSQAFSGVLRRSQSCEATWRQKGLDVVLPRKLTGWGCTWAYIPIQADEGSAADAPLSRQAKICCQKGVRYNARRISSRWAVLERTAH